MSIPIRYNDTDVLRPIVRDICIEMKNKVLSEGLPFDLFETFRSRELQQHYHTKNPKGAARPGYSYHEYGLAFDFVGKDSNGNWTWNMPNESWQRLGEIGKSLGLIWGGDWGWDKPHFEYSKDYRDIYAFIGDPKNAEYGNYKKEKVKDEYIDWIMSTGVITQEKDWHNTCPTWYEYIVTAKRLYDRR